MDIAKLEDSIRAGRLTAHVRQTRQYDGNELTVIDVIKIPGITTTDDEQGLLGRSNAFTLTNPSAEDIKRISRAIQERIP